MRFLLLTIFANIMLLGALSAQAQEQRELPMVFRNFVWGVTPEEVKKMETAELYDERGGLTYFEDIGRDRLIYRYEFSEGKLSRINVRFMEFHRTTPRAVLDVVADEKIKLEKKFGVPMRDALVWLDSSYRNIPQWFERAFAMGKVRIEAEWQTGNTYVLLQAFHNSYNYELSYTLENKNIVDDVDQGFQLFNFNE
jgi:hypothetical protein